MTQRTYPDYENLDVVVDGSNILLYSRDDHGRGRASALAAVTSELVKEGLEYFVLIDAGMLNGIDQRKPMNRLKREARGFVAPRKYEADHYMLYMARGSVKC